MHRLSGFPVLPLFSVIRILAHVDAPSWWLRWKEKTPALINRETTRHDSFGLFDECLADLGSRDLLLHGRWAKLGQIPYPRSGILRGGDDAGLVRRRRDAVDGVGVAFNPEQLGTALGVPYARGVVRGGSKDAGPVCRHRHASDGAGVALQLKQLASSLGVPQPCGFVCRAGDEVGPVRRHRHAANGAGVALELE